MPKFTADDRVQVKILSYYVIITFVVLLLYPYYFIHGFMSTHRFFALCFSPTSLTGGHAAHFANVQQRSPLFSQERAPTSVAYAENQSMFLDSLVGDAAWQARYALSREGEPIPWSLIEQVLTAMT